jgi:hypothetical protein
LNNAAADSNGNSLGAVIGAKFVHNVLHVNFDRPFGDPQQIGEIPVAISAG